MLPPLLMTELGVCDMQWTWHQGRILISIKISHLAFEIRLPAEANSQQVGTPSQHKEVLLLLVVCLVYCCHHLA